jgi:hypothetical protein
MGLYAGLTAVSTVVFAALFAHPSRYATSSAISAIATVFVSHCWRSGASRFGIFCVADWSVEEQKRGAFIVNPLFPLKNVLLV